MRENSKLIWEERQEVWLLRGLKWSVNAIARRLGRAVSTITRELRVNRHPVEGTWQLMNSAEKARYAHKAAKKRASKARKRLRLKSEELRNYVIKRLVYDHWSPEMISANLKLEFPERPEMRISAKSIYNFIKYDRYDQKELTKYLKRQGKPYRQRVSDRRGRFKQGAPDKRRISLRPVEINERSEYGHWEADTIHSVRGGSHAILSLCERKSRDRFFFKLPDLKAESTIAVLRPFFRGLPAEMRKSLTVDNGPEFATSELLALETLFAPKAPMTVYYCHPFRACERGTVEHSNGEFRWYHPKGTNFANVSLEEIKYAERQLNNKPMKILGWKTSSRVFNEVCQAMRAAEKLTQLPA